MIKKIAIKDVRLGMFVHELCGSWLSHPFWKKRFKLDSPKDLAVLKNSQILEVLIDTSKGLDVAEELPPFKPQEFVVQKMPAQVLNNPLTLFSKEIKQAKKIKERAKAVVFELFKEARIGHVPDLVEAKSIIEEIDQSIERDHNALVSLVRIKSKDNYTYLHSVAVGTLMVAFGKQLNLDPALRRDLGLAGLLHDLGKVAIPAEILNKPGRLTEEEFERIKTHPVVGARILGSIKSIPEIAVDVCRHHHERIDGKGYPDGISGDEITLYERMGAICDVYDAVTSERSYKNAWEPAEALRQMVAWKGSQFDPKLFDQFVRLIGIYPVGTLVQLKSHRLGVIISQSQESLLKPVVRVFYSVLSGKRTPFEDINLMNSEETIKQIEEPGNWSFDLMAIMEG